MTLLRFDPLNQAASMMLADVMFRNNQHDAAAYHFQQLLEKHPTRYEALHKLILLLRRAGRLAAEAPRFIKLAEKAKYAFAPTALPSTLSLTVA
jgi:tetratricopeptide repeat protein 21B